MNVEKPINIYKNLLWEILDDESKLVLIGILMNNGFVGDCKITSKVEGETSVLEVRDEYDHYLLLPIDILEMLNQ
jgi:hypothetical protein